MTARVDALEGAQVHRDVQRDAVIGPMPAHLDADRGDLGEPCERLGAGARRLQHGVAERIVEPDVDAGLAAHAMAGDAVGLERLQERLLEPEHVFLDVDAEPAQVDQRIGDDLAGAVVRDLAAAVGVHHRDRRRRRGTCSAPPGDALGEDGRVLAQPDLVGRVRSSRAAVKARIASSVRS